jgi:hypothetical protein
VIGAGIALVAVSRRRDASRAEVAEPS